MIKLTKRRLAAVENTATAANLEEALGLLAKACGIPVGKTGWEQYHSVASKQGRRVVIVIEPTHGEPGWKPAD